MVDFSDEKMIAVIGEITGFGGSGRVRRKEHQLDLFDDARGHSTHLECGNHAEYVRTALLADYALVRAQSSR